MIKKLFILLVVIASVCEKAKGQTNVYHPFPDSNAVWRVNGGVQTLSCASYPGVIIWYSQYTFLGDTVINTYSYKKVFVSGERFNCGSSGYYPYSYVGGLRQDSINKKVYFKATGYNDTLIYDFSKHVGDTLHLTQIFDAYSSPGGYPFSPTPTAYTVAITSIDSVLVGAHYHKRFNNTSGCSFIEGVGSLAGLLEGAYDYDSAFSISVGNTLICFSHYTDIYPSDSTSCKLITNNAGIKQVTSSNKVNIYPNPANTIINVELGIINENTTLQITDMLGSIHSTFIIHHSPFQISVADLSEGVYNISISSKEGVVNKRLVIVR